MIYIVSNPFTGKSERFASLDEAKSKYIEICKNVILIYGPKITSAISVDSNNTGLEWNHPIGDITQKSFFNWLNVSLNEFSEEDVEISTAGHTLPEEVVFYEELEKQKLQIIIDERAHLIEHLQFSEEGFAESDQYKMMIQDLQDAKDHLNVIIQNKQILIANASEEVVRAANALKI